LDSLKIEGRMKTALYVATVARTYRKAIDDYFTDPKLYEKNMDWYQAEISKCTYRQFTTGFYFGKPDENTQIYDNNTYVNEYIYLGIVEAVKDNLCRIEQRNKFCVGDAIEIMKPDGTNVPVTVEAMYTDDGESVDSAPHPKQVLWIKSIPRACPYFPSVYYRIIIQYSLQHVRYDGQYLFIKHFYNVTDHTSSQPQRSKKDYGSGRRTFPGDSRCSGDGHERLGD